MTTNETSRIVRWFVIIVLGAATAGMIAVSLRANYLFGYGFGQTPKRRRSSAGRTSRPICGKSADSSSSRACGARSRSAFALSLMPIWVLCLLWGLAGAIGVYAQDRTALIGGREAVAATYKDAERELEEIDAQVASTEDGAQRGASRCRDRCRAGATRSCPASACAARSESCQRIARKKIERPQKPVSKSPPCAKSAQRLKKRARLETRKATLRTQIAKLREGGGSLARRSGGRALCLALTRSAQRARYRLWISLGLCIPDRDRLGLRTGRHCRLCRSDAAHVRRQQHDTAGHGALWRASARCGERWRARARRQVDGGSHRTDRGYRRQSRIDDLHADYEVWCIGKNMSAAKLRCIRSTNSIACAKCLSLPARSENSATATTASGSSHRTSRSCNRAGN